MSTTTQPRRIFSHDMQTEPFQIYPLSMPDGTVVRDAAEQKAWKAKHGAFRSALDSTGPRRCSVNDAEGIVENNTIEEHLSGLAPFVGEEVVKFSPANHREEEPGSRQSRPGGCRG